MVIIVVFVLLFMVVVLILSLVMCLFILKLEDLNKKKNIVFCCINEWLVIGNYKYVGFIKYIVKYLCWVLSIFGMVLIVILLIYCIIFISFFFIED